MTIFDRLAGTPSGAADDRAPLLLLHGLTFDRRQWGPLLRELDAIDPGRRALALDLPGHGGSRHVGYDLATLPELVHRAVLAAGLDSPVVVGHSAGGILATMYAARFPAREVVNLDQPLTLGGFGDLVRRCEPLLRGPRWRQEVWDRLLAGMGVASLPAEGRELVESCEPHADQLLGYWKEILEHPDDVVNDARRAELTSILDRGIGYHLVVSAEPPGPPARGVRVTVLPGGHFPHLAHPAELAVLLRAR